MEKSEWTGLFQRLLSQPALFLSPGSGTEYSLGPDRDRELARSRVGKEDEALVQRQREHCCVRHGRELEASLGYIRLSFRASKKNFKSLNSTIMPFFRLAV